MLPTKVFQLTNISLFQLDVSYRKEQKYIWFRGGDLNGFRDIKPFYEVKEVRHIPGEHKVCVTRIYMV